MPPAYLELCYVDSHTGGEPTRIIHFGYPELNGANMAQKRTFLSKNHDWVRSVAVNEPRGFDAIVGAILLPSAQPDVDAGVIFFNNVGYINMCVHGTIGLAATLAHMGKLHSTNRAKIETPVGTVEAVLNPDNSVTVANVPSYRARKGVSINVPGFGTVKGDIAWGGNWFFLVEHHSLDVRLENISELTRFCNAARHALADAGITGEQGMEIDHVEVFAPPVSGVKADSQNFVLCPGGAYDRSPCGTGTSAKLACLYADGKLAPGQVWRQASVVGSIFEGKVDIRGSEIVPHITGSAFITGEGRLIVDPNDPFKYGIGWEV